MKTSYNLMALLEIVFDWRTLHKEVENMRGDYNIPRTGLKIEFDHNRDDYHRGHGLHCHVVSGRDRIASVNLDSLTVMAGSLDGKEGRLAMEWIRDNASILRDDAEYWRDNGATW